MRQAFTALKLLLLGFVLLAAGEAKAQAGINTDSLLQQAQKAAQQGQYAASRSLARQVLQAAPTYTDASILIGNTYAWEQRYDSANAVLLPLLTTAPQNTAVYLVLAKVAYWSKQAPAAIAFLEKGWPYTQRIRKW